MNSEWLAVVVSLIALIANVGTTAANIFLGERWKTRFVHEQASQDRAKALLDRYREPLSRAAFDLQSRLYNIVRHGFPSRNPTDYPEMSTLWIVGQWFAWNEILRREVQILDLGAGQNTARLQRLLMDIADMFASDSLADETFRVPRAEQRAIGELMVVERTESRTDAMGYAEFCERMNVPTFAAWFNHLRTGLRPLDDGRYRPRPVMIQRHLIDLLDFLDPQRIRFPDPNERGKLPAPADAPDPKRARPPFQIARFRFTPDQETDPRELARSWMAEFRGRILRRTEEEHLLSLAFRTGWFNRMTCHVEVRCDQHRPDRIWVEVNAWLQGRTPDSRRPFSGNRAPTDIVNDLLQLLDRPILIDINR